MPNGSLRPNEAMTEYKCRRCQQVVSGDIGKEGTLEVAVSEALDRGVSYTFNGMSVRLKKVHTCADGGRGVMDLIGMVIGKESEAKL
jgi:hypothetical protein